MPYIPEDLTDYITQAYVGLRNEDEDGNQDNERSNNRQRFCTARSLLSILRLSQAHARLYFRDHVLREDVDEAMRLVYVAKTTGLEEEDKKDLDPSSAIYNMLVTFSRDKKSTEIKLKDVRQRIVTKGFSDEQIQECLATYEDLGVWALSRNKESIRFLPLQNNI
jgi:DNA replication licensing factor MCM7